MTLQGYCPSNLKPGFSLTLQHVYNIPEATKDVSLKKCRDMLEEDSITGI
jgi:hypothetical protein